MKAGFESWLSEQSFDDFIVYLGIDWTEEHRLVAHRKHVEHRVEAPLCDKPFMSDKQVKKALADEGIELPYLYKIGFSHNNCGGTCVKAGQGQWAEVLKLMPERYAEQERLQNEMMAEIPTARPFLRMTISGKLEYLSLTDFRKHIESNQQVDIFDVGGCGCFVDS